MNSVSVFGIGKLGLPLAASLANKEYRVIGVDLNQAVVNAVNEHKSPFYEPGLDRLVKSAGENLSATVDYGDAVRNTELSFIIVPTPSQPDGSFSTKFVEEVVDQLAVHLKQKDGFHVVVVTSTVLPGATEGVIKSLLEQGSGKKCARDFGLCYNPEFIALGSVIRDFNNPDVVLIGESDSRSGEMLAEVHRRTCDNNPPIIRTTIQNAELAKISLNAYVTMKITFANTLAEMAERIPGGDAEVISAMLGHDTRIGLKYLRGGLPYGGPCFPRDNRAFASVARKLGCQAKLAVATDDANSGQVARVVELIEHELGGVRNRDVAMLGLTYKPNTDVVEESAPVKIALNLKERGARVSVYDPAGMSNARHQLGEEGIRYATSATDCLKGAEFCILATPWPEFKKLTGDDFSLNMRNASLLDCWRMFDRSALSGKVKYAAIGLAPVVVHEPVEQGQRRR